MQTKLTVRVDQRWLEQARRYSAEHGTTLSKLISEFLRGLSTAERPLGDTPIMDRLTGILPADVDVEDYRRHLAEKHRG
jgi:hypothetical protein